MTNTDLTARERAGRAPRPLPVDAIVRWRDGYRPTGCTWETGKVFISTARQTVVQNDQGDHWVATLALEVVK